MIDFHGLQLKKYRYYNKEKNSIDFEGMLSDLAHMQSGDLLLIQNCGHNPTGFDPTQEQWQKIADLIQSKSVHVFFDFAYMGFASGDIHNDAYSVNLFLQRQIPFTLTFSCAKNFGLYSLRVGFFMAVTTAQTETNWMLEYLTERRRRILGMPTSFGQWVVREIVQDPSKKEHWYTAFKTMASRLHANRVGFRDGLKSLQNPRDWDFIVKQTGMFAYTGLSAEEAKELDERFGIFILASGRASMSGLSQANVGYAAKGFHEVTKHNVK